VHNRVSRFTASGDTALAASELVLLDLNNLSGATNHNGGAIHFGPDGRLYIGVGENATPSNSQTNANLLGKILRMDSDGNIPLDNPFYATASGQNRLIWALGLRNPFTFAFQPGNGRMLINDVGAGSWEEINPGVVGANYGWPTTEGYTTNASFTSPIHAYPHGAGTSAGNCIAGGAFYNPPVDMFPVAYRGLYFYADYTNNWIRTLRLTDSVTTIFATDIPAPVDLQIGPDGALYYIARGNGGLVGVIRYAATSVGEDAEGMPAGYRLEQNYPNPFNPSTNIGVRIVEFALVKLAVYDLLGREVAVLVNEKKEAGIYKVKFDASGLPSGVYFYRLLARPEREGQGGRYVEAKKLCVLK
jgi:glucose/arabinose dehydrogenase